jgi:hypothetical protein
MRIRNGKKEDERKIKRERERESRLTSSTGLIALRNTTSKRNPANLETNMR